MKEARNLTVKSIDLKGSRVYLELTHQGLVVDSKVVAPSKSGATLSDKTYYYRENLDDAKNIVTIAVHFEKCVGNSVLVDGIWQIGRRPKVHG